MPSKLVQERVAEPENNSSMDQLEEIEGLLDYFDEADDFSSRITTEVSDGLIQAKHANGEVLVADRKDIAKLCPYMGQMALGDMNKILDLVEVGQAIHTEKIIAENKAEESAKAKPVVTVSETKKNTAVLNEGTQNVDSKKQTIELGDSPNTYSQNNPDETMRTVDVTDTEQGASGDSEPIQYGDNKDVNSSEQDDLEKPVFKKTEVIKVSPKPKNTNKTIDRIIPDIRANEYTVPLRSMVQNPPIPKFPEQTVINEPNVNQSTVSFAGTADKQREVLSEQPITAETNDENFVQQPLTESQSLAVDILDIAEPTDDISILAVTDSITETEDNINEPNKTEMFNSSEKIVEYVFTEDFIESSQEVLCAESIDTWCQISEYIKYFEDTEVPGEVEKVEVSIELKPALKELQETLCSISTNEFMHKTESTDEKQIVINDLTEKIQVISVLIGKELTAEQAEELAMHLIEQIVINKDGLLIGPELYFDETFLYSDIGTHEGKRSSNGSTDGDQYTLLDQYLILARLAIGKFSALITQQ